MGIGPQAMLALVPGGSVETSAPNVAVARWNLAAQMAEIVVWNGYFENPALVDISMVVECAAKASGDLHALALPGEMDIAGPFVAAAKGDVVEQGAFDIHFVAEVRDAIFALGSVGGGEDFNGVLSINRAVVGFYFGV